MPERIRVQARDGRWETLGVDRQPGIHPQGISPSWSAWGPDRLSFTIARNPELNHHDLAAFTPIEYLPRGDDHVTWSGRIIDTPGATAETNTITVLAHGDQYRLDDDPYQHVYAHDDLTAWRISKTHPTADIGPGRDDHQASKVETGTGAIVLGWDKDAWLATAGPVRAGVYLDMGANARARRIIVTYESSNNDAGMDLAVVFSDRPKATGLPAEWPAAIVNNAGAGGTIDFTCPQTSGFRYVHIFARHTLNGQAAAECFFRITRARVLSVEAVAWGGSVTADRVAVDAAFRVPLIDPTELVDASTFDIRDLGSPTGITPRAWIERANSYLGWQAKVDHRRRLLLRPQPARALIEVDTRRPGVRFQDTTTSAALESFNKAIVRGRSGAGEPLEVIRYSGHATEDALDLTGIAQPTNASATDVASPWTVATGTVTRDTGHHHTAPASWHAVADALGDVDASIAVAGALTVGHLYFFDFWAQRSAEIPGIDQHAYLEITLTPSGRRLRLDLPQATDWRRYGLAWRQTTADTGYTVRLAGHRYLFATVARVDDLRLSRMVLTEPDRRGLFRSKELDVQAPSDAIAMESLGDAWLRLGARTPLKGTLVVDHPDGARFVVGGRSIPPEDLGLYTDELLLIKNLIDPATGHLGRIGTIASVSAPGGVATVAIDNSRDSLQALLNRMALGTGT